MEFPAAYPQNWSRTFTVWVQDIRVAFDPRVVCQELSGGALRWMRSCTRHAAAILMGLFVLHCLKPQLVAAPAVAPVWKDHEVFRDPSPHQEEGLASFYGWEDGFAGGVTASGELFDPNALTCAHRSLPFGTLIALENQVTGARVIVRVNDRGPFVRGRVVDVSPRAARKLGLMLHGLAPVRLNPVMPEVPQARVFPAAPQALGSEDVGFTLEGQALANLFRASLSLDGSTLPQLFSARAGGFQAVAADPDPRHRQSSGRSLLPPFLHRES